MSQMLKGLKKKFATKPKEIKPEKLKSPSSPTASDGEPRKRAASGTQTDSPLSPFSDSQPCTKAELLKPIPTFQETTAANRPALLLLKLRLCQVMFDWSDEAGPKDNRAKDVKRQQLLELVEYVGKNKNIFNEVTLAEIIKMVGCNLFRALPPKQAQHGF